MKIGTRVMLKDGPAEAWTIVGHEPGLDGREFVVVARPAYAGRKTIRARSNEIQLTNVGEGND